ncbi:MAG: YHS domain-containing protein [Pseudomonadota bacterium]
METRTHPTIPDPVCGMAVDPGQCRLTHRHQGTDYLFCSDTCRKAFEADPGKYLGRKPGRRKGWWGRYLDRLQKATGGKPPACCG